MVAVKARANWAYTHELETTISSEKKRKRGTYVLPSEFKPFSSSHTRRISITRKRSVGVPTDLLATQSRLLLPFGKDANSLLHGALVDGLRLALKVVRRQHQIVLLAHDIDILPLLHLSASNENEARDGGEMGERENGATLCMYLLSSREVDSGAPASDTTEMPICFAFQNADERY